MVNDDINDNGLVTACEARFILDPNLSFGSESVLILVWACPDGVSAPPTSELDDICVVLFSSKLVTSCTSPSGFTLQTITPELPDTT